MFVVVLAYIEYCGVKLDVAKWTAKMAKDLEYFNEALEALNKWVIENCDENILKDMCSRIYLILVAQVLNVK